MVAHAAKSSPPNPAWASQSHMTRKHIILHSVAATLFSLGILVHAADIPLAAGKYPAKPRKAAERAGTPAPKPEEKKRPYGDEKPFADVVKEMEISRGLFTFYRKTEENKVYLEILPDQFDRTFLFSSSVERGAGERWLYSAQMGGHFPFQFRLSGKTVQWVMLNSTFTAEEGTPAQRAVERSFTHSIAGSARILSQPHPERKSFLINLSDLLLTDLPQLAAALRDAYRPSEYRFDRANSAITRVKSFTENALCDVALHYVSDNPRTRSLTLPDARSVPFLVKYDFSALRPTDFQPRLADDRVGHFLSLQQDFTSDRPTSPFVRRIHRWNLQKKDPSAAISEPIKPITFWIENTVPVEYRQWIADGALMWNKAFERAGFKDAIVVKQQPDDAVWDPADTRYNVIRWFAGVDASFAIGPSRANPYTGEIYDADISISEGIVRSIRRGGEEWVAPSTSQSWADPALLRPRLNWQRDGGHLCELGDGLAHQAAFGAHVLASRGDLSPGVQERLIREFLVYVTAHEVGHTLGLRHNFRASTMLAAGDLLDEKLTGERGQSGSVMDYHPIVLAAKGQRTGHFLPVTLGPYDYWAIEYAYKPFADDEGAQLKALASRAAEPQLAYSTDEDALGTYSPAAVDPLANQFDQSADPLEYFEQRIAIIHELWTGMEGKLAREGEGYQVLRRAMDRSLGEYYRGLLIATKFVGGLYHYRDHVGQQNGRAPFEPVQAARQKQALDFLRLRAFSEDAFRLSPDLYNKLAPERLPGLDGLDGLFAANRLDTPWHDSVLNLQRAVLQRLHAPATLARIEDNELRFDRAAERFTMSDLFAGLESAIWSELAHAGEGISSIRRNLQREHLKTLTRLALRTHGGIPEDATSLARATLVRLDRRTEEKLHRQEFRDPASRAHLEETRARIAAALEAQVSKGLE